MNEQDLQSEYAKIVGSMRESVGRFENIVGKTPNQLIAVNAYEACRRAEDYIARVNNVMAILSSRTEEAVDQAVNAAVDSGTVVTQPA